MAKSGGIKGKLVANELIQEPVEVGVVFWFKRPLKQYRSNGMVRQDAPVYITNKNKGDLNKHCRALLDSLTGSAFADDSQVVSLHAVKKYCETDSETGANIKIRTINEKDFMGGLS